MPAPLARVLHGWLPEILTSKGPGHQPGESRVRVSYLHAVVVCMVHFEARGGSATSNGFLINVVARIAGTIPGASGLGLCGVRAANCTWRTSHEVRFSLCGSKYSARQPFEHHHL